jgi:hypothetical protein
MPVQANNSVRRKGFSFPTVGDIHGKTQKTLISILLEISRSPGINCAFLKLISKTMDEELVCDHALIRTYVGAGPQYR